MKKYLALIFMAVVAFALTACGGKTTTTKKTTEATQATTTKAEATTTKADVTTTEAAGDLDKAVDEKYANIVEGKKLYLTTCGQADIYTVRNLISAADESEEVINFYNLGDEEADADYTYNVGMKDLLDASEVENGSVVFLVLGTSGKGLGSAGTDVARETARAQAFAAKAEAGEITLIVFHVGGADRRGANTDPVLDAVCAKAEIAFVVEGGNADGYFTNLTNDGVSVYRYSKMGKMTAGVAVLFGIEE